MIKEKRLLKKSNISNLNKNSDLNKKLGTLATKTEKKRKRQKFSKA